MCRLRITLCRMQPFANMLIMLHATADGPPPNHLVPGPPQVAANATRATWLRRQWPRMKSRNPKNRKRLESWTSWTTLEQSNRGCWPKWPKWPKWHRIALTQWQNLTRLSQPSLAKLPICMATSHCWASAAVCAASEAVRILPPEMFWTFTIWHVLSCFYVRYAWLNAKLGQRGATMTENACDLYMCCFSRSLWSIVIITSFFF